MKNLDKGEKALGRVPGRKGAFEGRSSE